MERLTYIDALKMGQIKGLQLLGCKWACDNSRDCKNCLVGKAITKLAEYEDLEEQGLLLRLPCKVGDKFYRIRRTCYSNQLAPKGKYFPSKHYCEDFCPHYDCDGYDVITEDTFESIGEIVTHQAWIGRYLFLTREEAEAKLKEMGENV